MFQNVFPSQLLHLQSEKKQPQLHVVVLRAEEELQWEMQRGPVLTTCAKSDMCYVRHVLSHCVLFFPFIHLYMCGVVLRWTCGGQESICGGQFSFFTVWTWGPNSGLGGRLLYHWLTHPPHNPPHPLSLICLLRTIQNFLPAQNTL